ncbi:hypothetical protein BDN71DRAFT_1511370 [Pleurotus eryngii]|uniref:Uncharacterized protein n=1 Tax=Pleurotus eryngii TaxID=5323 RepID=A0A9P5ZM57_PLEER|nr:hypothetical protein BDN71DRAFT_1511370 [Pleurotus eryngii]
MTAAVLSSHRRLHLDVSEPLDAFDYWHTRRKADQHKIMLREATIGRRQSTAADVSKFEPVGISRKPPTREIRAMTDVLGCDAGIWGRSREGVVGVGLADSCSSREDSATSDDGSSCSEWEDEATPRPLDFVPSFSRSQQNTPRASFLVPKAISGLRVPATSNRDDRPRYTSGKPTFASGELSTSDAGTGQTLRVPYCSPMGMTLKALSPSNFEDDFFLVDFAARKQILRDFHRAAYRAEIHLILSLGSSVDQAERAGMLREHDRRMEILSQNMVTDMIEKQKKSRTQRRCSTSDTRVAQEPNIGRGSSIVRGWDSCRRRERSERRSSFRPSFLEPPQLIGGRDHFTDKLSMRNNQNKRCNRFEGLEDISSGQSRHSRSRRVLGGLGPLLDSAETTDEEDTRPARPGKPRRMIKVCSSR